MKRLLIARHAKAVKAGAGEADFDRALARRGEHDASEMGRRLARRRAHPDLVVASPAARALETARIIARELDFPWNEIRVEKSAYLADAQTLLDLVRGFGQGVESALLVGHNPGVSELARALAREFGQELPTAAVVMLDLPADTWRGVRPGSGLLRLYDHPKAGS